MRRTVTLAILDGWGIGQEDDSNPIHAAHPKNLGWLAEHFPLTSLEAAGIHVGLPWGETGNSEVGHLTLGAGKIMYQHYPRISLAIRDGSFFQNPVLLRAFAHAREHNSAVHFVGLLSKANTHASLEHLLALVRMASEQKTDRYWLHLFADGKDSPPRSILEMLPKLPREKIATLMGRYYAMDREGNWQLTRTAYETLTTPAGRRAQDPEQVATQGIAELHTEEFLPAYRFQPEAVIGDRDTVIFFNFREDSIRQIAEAFILPDFKNFPVRRSPDQFLATFTQYEERFAAPVAFPPDHVDQPLGRVLSDAGKTQVHLAESYKYAHVTMFFNGYREEPFSNEYRVLVPSLQIPHPDEHPELMASAVTDRLIQSMEGSGFDFILVNFANGDTIGHTGNYNAAVKAVGVIDEQIGRILPVVARSDGILVITSDHGNIERIFNPETGRPETQHDPSPVPFYLVGREFKGRKFFNARDLPRETAGNLADIAPTILALMGLTQPEEMTGRNLLDSLL